MVKLGLLSAILPEYSFEQVAALARDLALGQVELACWPTGKAERRYAGVSHLDALRYDKSAIRDTLSAAGVSIAALGYYPNPLDADPGVRAAAAGHLKALIDMASALTVRNVSTFIGKDPKKTLSENLAAFRAVWPDLIRYAADRGVRVCIENCPMYFTMDEWPGGKNLATAPAIWDEMFSAIDSPWFGLSYDPSHMVIQRMDYLRPIYDYADKIYHVHIKDVLFHQDRLNRVGFLAPPLEYCTPKLPGQGDIAWGKVISALQETGYRGAAVIEVEDRACEGSLEDRLEAVRISVRCMRQYAS